MTTTLIFFAIGYVVSFLLGIRHNKQYTRKEIYCSYFVAFVFIFAWSIIFIKTL